MYLKKRDLWGRNAASIAGDGCGGDPPVLGQAATGLPPETAAMVGELVSALDRRRMHREVTLALRSGIRDASADFSFLRLRGLRNLLKSLRSIANSDDAIRLFRYSQTLSELQALHEEIREENYGEGKIRKEALVENSISFFYRVHHKSILTISSYIEIAEAVKAERSRLDWQTMCGQDDSRVEGGCLVWQLLEYLESRSNEA